MCIRDRMTNDRGTKVPAVPANNTKVQGPNSWRAPNSVSKKYHLIQPKPRNSQFHFGRRRILIVAQEETEYPRVSECPEITSIANSLPGFFQRKDSHISGLRLSLTAVQRRYFRFIMSKRQYGRKREKRKKRGQSVSHITKRDGNRHRTSIRFTDPRRCD